jgi:hypothetical protein
MRSMIQNIDDLAAYLGVEVDYISRRVYNDSECGIYFMVVTEEGNFGNNEVIFSQIKDKVIGISMNSIIEGSNAEFSADDLMFPFSQQDFEDAVQFIEDIVDDFFAKNPPDEEQEDSGMISRGEIVENRSRTDQGKTTGNSRWYGRYRPEVLWSNGKKTYPHPEGLAWDDVKKVWYIR